MLGKVKWFNNEKGYGFIVIDDLEDIFVHYSVIDAKGYKTLKEGEEVVLEYFKSSKGLQASFVAKLEDNN